MKGKGGVEERRESGFSFVRKTFLKKKHKTQFTYQFHASPIKAGLVISVCESSKRGLLTTA